MKIKLPASLATTYVAFALIPLHAEKSAPAPQVVQAPSDPIQNHRVAPSTPKTEPKTVAVAELENIRLNLSGTISFRETTSGITYQWVAPPGESRQVVLATVLGELRKAEKIELIVYPPQGDGDGKEFRIMDMSIVYKSLK